MKAIECFLPITRELRSCLFSDLILFILIDNEVLPPFDLDDSSFVLLMGLLFLIRIHTFLVLGLMIATVSTVNYF